MPSALRRAGADSHPARSFDIFPSLAPAARAFVRRLTTERSVTLLVGLLFGLLQGLRHAFEPDHVVAISTMISEQRSGRTRVAYAAAWGMGHAAMLVLVGGVLMFLRTELPPRLDAGFELAVSLMLIGLGVRAVHTAVREARASSADEVPLARPRGRWRGVGPVAMGVVHGLAGSGALTALVVARLPSPVAGLIFMVVFGAGAALGMSLLAGAAGVPLSRVLRHRWGIPALLGATGSVSLLLGAAWLVPAALRVVHIARSAEAPVSAGPLSVSIPVVRIGCPGA